MVNRDKTREIVLTKYSNIKVRRIVKACLALLFSFLLINVVAFFYDHDPQWISREGGPTKGVYAPGHFVFRLDEGIGFAQIDENGYVNVDTNIGRDYVLVMGKSHTNGTEVFQGNRYVDILDKKLKGGSGRRAYCVASGASTFADLLSGFDALVEEFPDSSAIIIEMTDLDSPDEYLRLNNPRIWTESMSAKYLFDHQSIKQKVGGFVKEYLPLVAYYINYKYPKMKLFDSNAFFQASENVDLGGNSITDGTDLYELEDNLDFALAHIRSTYDGEIIILYHPNVVVDKSGEMQIKKMQNQEILENCCNANNIRICDMSGFFVKNYDADHIIPYGFWNTSMCEGHLNADGHRMIADYLYSAYFEEDE